ncbi:transporter substrate-binding protein [Aurantimonas sp. VKM B-3413]|uniref:transporter substrate-binding protein n=1 Tax=Aurantimonas sp. VKM B-3413 TaxID=2779401 RepID=UPI001E3ADC05|nr:transporter substrate-binding protein [Aurantimonas sp. VKM B-3413]MCB8839819.1 transporter substrate-binding protein [Aurantimonas sp. VKM B-3413]
MKQTIEIGILFSRSGHYQLLSDACHAGAMLGIAAVNSDSAAAIRLMAVERDPEGQIDRYAPLCEEILKQSSARHVIGCITSWSRKEVIPVLEKTGATLWYPCPYEGFEANEHVVYMHASPNQHLVPLLAYVLPRNGRDAFLVGSNYIWGWETNRVARDLVSDAGGSVVGERYLPLGDTDVSRLVAEIRATRPSFVLNHLIGPSSYAFLKALRDLAGEDPAFAPENCPVLSCNLTEIELPAIGPAATGHLAVGPWFQDRQAPWPWERPAVPGLYPAGPSSFFVSAFSSVLVLADMLMAEAGGERPLAFAGRSFSTPFGEIAIDPQTQHASLPVRIGRVRDGGFDVVEQSEGRVDPDPYLSRYDPARVFGRPFLRAVS